MQRRGRDIARGPTTPKRALSAAHIEAMQRGRSTQRARAVSASAEKARAGSMGAEVRHAGREARAEAVAIKQHASFLDTYIGETGQGVPLTRERIILCLRGYYSADDLADTLRSPISVDSVARRRVATLLSGLSPKTVTKVIACWEQTGELALEVPGTRGASAAAYTRWDRLPADAELAVRAHLLDLVQVQQQPICYTRQVLQGFLEEKYGVAYSLRVCGRLMASWGYTYGDYGRQPLGGTSVARQIAKQIFLVQLDNCLKRKHVIYYQDESYANVRLAVYRGYGPADDHTASFVPKAGGLGQRLCFAQVLGYDGLLIGEHRFNADTGWALPANGDLDADPRFGAEIMFEAASGTGDYHGNFDGVIFMKYVVLRLIPALKRKHPNAFTAGGTEHITIVLDRAPYHCKSSGDRFNPLNPSKKPSRPELVATMRAIMLAKGVAPELTVVQKGVRLSKKAAPIDVTLTVTLDDAEMTRRGKAGSAALLPELRYAAYAWRE